METTPYFLSAYMAAVKHGFQGTEKEWLEQVESGSAPDELRQMYEEARLAFGVSMPREREEQAQASRGDFLSRVLFYGSAAVLGILLRLIIKSML